MKQPDAPERQRHMTWALLWIAVLVLGTALGMWSYRDYLHLEKNAADSLMFRAQNAATNLERRLKLINMALNNLREIAPSLALDQKEQEITNRQMKVLGDSLEGVGAMALYDAAGTIVASNRPEIINKNFSDRAYFQLALKEKDASKLYVNAPFRTILGVFSIVLAKSIVREDGEFVGIVIATLDPEVFSPALKGLLESPDAVAGIAHASGQVFLFTPTTVTPDITQSALLGTFHADHRASGLPSTVQTGFSLDMQNERMVALTTVKPERLMMDNELIVTVSRDLRQISAEWRNHAVFLAYLFSGITLLSCLSLHFYHRRLRTLEDVTRDQDAWRLQAEEKERWSLALLNATGQIAHVGGWSLDAVSKELTWTDEIYRIHELPLGSHIDVTMAAGFCLPDCRQSLRVAIRQALNCGTAFDLELELTTTNGRQIWVRVQGICECDAAVGKTLRVYGAFQDISERKLAEQKLRSTSQLLQNFLDHLPGMAYIKDQNLRVVMANRGFQLIGLNPQSMVGKNNLELLPSPFGENVTADEQRIFTSGAVERLLEEWDGRSYESTKFVIEDDNGQRLLGGITLDVTAHQHSIRLTQSLLEIHELSGQLVERDFLTKGLELAEQLTHSNIGFLHFVNDDQETLELVTWTSNALKGCTAVHDSHYPISQAGIWADCFRQRSPVVFNDYATYNKKHGLPEGHAPLHRLISVPVIEDNVVRMMIGVGNKQRAYEEPDIQAVQLIGNDLWRVVQRSRANEQLQQRITELSVLNTKLAETQGQLLQSEKLSAIGQLAAGVAHEINNPIGFVYSNLATLAEYVDDLLAIDATYSDMEDHLHGVAPQLIERVRALKLAIDHAFVVTDLRQLLRESREGLERVKTIVRDLKDFSRTGDTEWDWADLHMGLESTLNIVHNEIKYKAQIVRKFAPLPPVRCIAGQINQVFMNLLVNAAQSIAERGQITLCSGVDGEFVWITVQDDGCGIAPDKLTRIFEPFYTSKPIGKGTGLGLTLAWGIVQRHQGTIEVQSSPGQGTCFTLRLPIAGPVVAEAPVATDLERL